MATKLELGNLREGYIELIEHVTRHGHQVAPRGIPIIELNDVTFTVDDLRDVLPLGVGRELNLNIAAVETLQLISGTSRADLVVATTRQFGNYREPNGEFYGAYGDRIGGQAQYVINKLVADRDSRQAVITLWDPRLDNRPGKLDYPCTVALGFRIRHDRLDLSVIMRSNDLWLGTAYDVFQFTQLQWSIAAELDVTVGAYTHTAWSIHLYERDLARTAKLQVDANWPLRFHPMGIASNVYGTFDEVAEEILCRPNSFSMVVTRTPSQDWYLTRMLDVHRRLDRSESEQA